MPIEGPLRELGIHDVFQLLDLSRKTGVLRVTSDLRLNDGKIYFDEGAVVFAEMRSNPHQIGTLLVRTGKITESDLERARELQTKGDARRLGEILVEMGAVTPRDVERQVRFQIEEVVFEVMSWNEGFFSFSEEPGPDVAMRAVVRIRTEALLMEGARRIDEWSRIEKRVPHVGVVPHLAALSSGTSPALDLLPAEWEVLAMIDSTRDVRTIARQLGRSDFDVAKTLFGLESAGVILLIDPGAAARERPGGGSAAELAELLAGTEAALARHDHQEARAAAEQAAAAHPENAAIHLLLGRVQLAAGRPAEAVTALRQGVRLDPRLAAAHRLLGHALAAIGRFGEAVEQWEHWERLTPHGPAEAARVEEVQQAKAAALTLGRAGVQHG
ncbi:MAG TPA: DUF4388 domain-containing protein [Gemmatimonadales bacterium]|nr:DUF4388 domain-containing protein [Gemmatimonadales bacterium]